MKTNFISKEGNDAKFTIVFTAEEFENAIVDAYKQNKDKFAIDGFRKGKAPRKMIENHYGKTIFYDEALNGLLGSAYPAALSELSLEVIDSPRLEVSDIDKGADITVTATVACFPEVEVKDYFGIEVDRVKTEIGDEEIEEDLKRIQKSQARMETVEDRKSEDGDTVIIDFEGSVDGELFDGGKGENFELKLGSGQFIPGFEDQLIGQDAGAEVEVAVTFPEEYGAKDLAGKAAIFKTKIHEIKKEVLPEIDDELASDVSEFETLEELKKDVAANLQKNADTRDASVMKNQMLDRFYEANDLDIPDVMVEDEIDKMVQEMNQQLTYQGLNLEQYMQYLGQTMKDVREGSRADARKRVGMRILIKAVIKKEGIEATEEEINEELVKFAEGYGQPVEQVRKMIGEDNLRYFAEDVQTRKVVDVMFAEAKQVEKKDAE